MQTKNSNRNLCQKKCTLKTVTETCAKYKLHYAN